MFYHLAGGVGIAHLSSICMRSLSGRGAAWSAGRYSKDKAYRSRFILIYWGYRIMRADATISIYSVQNKRSVPI